MNIIDIVEARVVTILLIGKSYEPARQQSEASNMGHSGTGEIQNSDTKLLQRSSGDIKYSLGYWEWDT